MPMAVMVVLVLTTLLSVMLERHVAQLLASRRQLDAYAFGQTTRGISEALEAWIDNNGNNPIAAALDADGLAFSLSTDDGQVVRMYLSDGQGLALSELSGLSGDTLKLGYEVIDRLVKTQHSKARQLVRRDGPLAVSVNSAPKEVLQAVIEAADIEGVSGDLLSTLLDLRAAQGPLTPEDLTQAIQAAVPEGASRSQLSAMLTANPALWRVRVFTEAGGPGRVMSGYRAYALITRTAAPGVGDRASAIDRHTAIFGWEPIEDR